MQILDLKTVPFYIPVLAEWHHREWSYLNPGRSLEMRMEYMEAYLFDDLIPSTFIARDVELMGSASIVASDMDDRPELTPWLASVFVAPAFRDNGVGGRLVRHVMQQARVAGMENLYLFTPDRESFYEKLGWRVLSRENYRGCLVTVMSVNLDCERNFG